MKKIVIASAAMGGAALIAFGASGTFAALSDTNTQTVAAGAGTLSLWVGHPASSSAHAGNLAPGESVVMPFYVKNSGNNVAGNLGVALKDVFDQENGCSSESEKTADPGCADGANTGEFSHLATYKVGVSPDGEQTCSAASQPTKTPYVSFPASVTTLPPAASGIVLDPQQGACVLLTITLPSTTGSDDNKVQGDSMSFKAELTLEQKVKA